MTPAKRPIVKEIRPTRPTSQEPLSTGRGGSKGKRKGKQQSVAELLTGLQPPNLNFGLELTPLLSSRLRSSSKPKNMKSPQLRKPLRHTAIVKKIKERAGGRGPTKRDKNMQFQLPIPIDTLLGKQPQQERDIL